MFEPTRENVKCRFFFIIILHVCWKIYVKKDKHMLDLAIYILNRLLDNEG